MSEMKKILVQGYLNHNLGDDLFFKILTERYKNVEWYFVGIEDELLTSIKKNNIHTISNKEFLLSFYKYDGLVNIGGSIFMQQKRWFLQYLKRLFYAIPLKLSNKKIMVMGSNFGPYKNKYFKELYSYYFKFIDYVSFRDNVSYELFKKNNKIIKASDIVFTLNKNDIIDQPNGKVIGISLMDLSWRESLKKYEQSYLECIEELVNNLRNNGYSVKLFSFCSNEGDQKVSDYLIDKLKDQRITQVNYDGDIDSFLMQFSQVNAHICMRFHSLILSILYNIPFYQIIYSDKTLNVLNDLGINKNFVGIKEINELNVKDIINVVNELPINTDTIVKDASNHFSFLDRLIGEDDF